jgi:benzoyl-CoA reductase/2-hydroxyglutaryl-CoA dehydratase subunit BcrC/BadD/HgdB
MDPISTSGDMISNYASYMQNAMIDFGYDNLNMAKNILHFIDENHINGVIYNQLFGCHSLSTGYFRLRQELLKREIPSTMVSFNQVGENREQLKTRVIALMELLHQ